MPWFRINQFDTDAGAVGDLPPQSVPPNVFTDAMNVRFADGAVEKVPGMQEQYGTPPIAPYYLLSSQDNDGIKRLFLAGTTKIYYYLSGNFSNATRQTAAVDVDYSAGTTNVWTGGVLHGIPVLNNGTDAPQRFVGGVTVKFQDLDNWPAGYTCRSLRPFKNYLVAMNIDDGTTVYPHNVMWSHPADPGTVPSSWNVADATKDAGDAPLSDTAGQIVDGLAMGDSFVIYKEDATYLMQSVGAPYIFKFRPVLRESGILSRNCIAEVSGRHAVLTTDDVILFDGNGAESVINRKWRRELFASISVLDYEKSFAVTFPDRREAWFCISTITGHPPNLAFVWDWKQNTWSKRELPFAQSLVYAYAPDEAGESWDVDAGTWNADGEGWSAFTLRSKATVVCSPSLTKIYTVNVGETMAGTPMIASAEHRSFDFANEKDTEIADVVKHISKVRPRVLADAGTVVNFQIGTQMNLNDSITWTAPMHFTVGTDEELCLGVNGRYISWKIYSDTDCTWRLEALDLLVQTGGRF